MTEAQAIAVAYAIILGIVLLVAAVLLWGTWRE